MKKIGALVWVLLVLFAASALAEDTEYVWKDYKYRILADGTAEITGHEKTDLKYYNILTGKDKRIRNLEIPARVNGIPVTSIGRVAFSMCASLQKVTIPEGVTHIHELAFTRCTNIKTLKLPATLVYIGENAFSENESLSSVKFPKNLTHIGAYAFHGCDKLKKLTLPDALTFLGNDAFGFCESLKEVSIGAGLEQPGYDDHTGECANPFGGCKKLTTLKVSRKNPHLAVMDGCLVDLKDMRLIAYPPAKKGSSFTVPQGIRIIGEGAFSWCEKLEKITFPAGVERLARFAVSNLRQLRELQFEEGLMQLDAYSLSGVFALEKMTLPLSLTVIGEKIAEYCGQQVTLYVPSPCPAVPWGTGMGFRVIFTDPGAFTILSPEANDLIDLKYGGDMEIRWLAYPDADEYAVHLTFVLADTGARVDYPTLYTDGDPDARGVCSVTVSPPSIFHRMYEATGGPYAYSRWQAEVTVEACRIR